MHPIYLSFGQVIHGIFVVIFAALLAMAWDHHVHGQRGDRNTLLKAAGITIGLYLLFLGLIGTFVNLANKLGGH